MVEILSPTTAHRDRGVKRKLYDRQGVSVYWIVDPDARAVEVWTFGTEPGHGRFTDLLAVTRAGKQIGEKVTLTIWRTATRAPRRASMAAAFSSRSLTTPAPTLPRPSRPTPISRRLRCSIARQRNLPNSGDETPRKDSQSVQCRRKFGWPT